MAATPPTAPDIVPRPRPATSSIQFYWLPPGSDGGSPVISYTLACPAIGYTQVIPATEATATADPVPARQDLTFTLTATNAVGTGPPATFRTVQAGTTPIGPFIATLSSFNASTGLIQWSPSSTTTEALVKWYRIQALPSSATMSSFFLTQKNYRFASLATNLSTNMYYQFLVQGVNDVGYCTPFAYTSTVGFGIVRQAFSPSTLSQQLGLWIDGTNAGSYTLDGATSTVTRLQSLTAPAFSTATVTGLSVTPNYAANSTVFTTDAAGGAATFPFTTTPYTSSALTALWVGTLNSLPQPSRILSVDTPQVDSQGNRAGILIGAEGTAIAPSTLLTTRGSAESTTARASLPAFSTLSLVTASITPYLQYTTVNGSNTLQSRGTFSTFNVGNLNLGQANPSTFFAGRHAEMLVYYDELSLYDRQRVEGYMAWKWGLNNSLAPRHPFKFDPPNSDTFTPAFFPSRLPGLVTWLDAADPEGTGASLPTGTPLTTWVDKSFSSRSATAVGATPVYRASTSSNPDPYIDMSGAGYYSLASASQLPAVQSNYFSMFIVERIQGGSYGLLTGGSSAATNTNNVFSYIPLNLSGVSWSFINNDLNIVSGISSFTNAAAQPTRIWSAAFTPSNRSVYLNGILMGSNTANARLSSWSNATIGYSAHANLYYIGQYKEFAMVLGEVSALNRQRMEGYLAWKWGLTAALPAGHPYKTLEPTT
jgi:hypothetical protein